MHMAYENIYIYIYNYLYIYIYLVGGWALPLKKMVELGWWISQYMENMFQTPTIYIYRIQFYDTTKKTGGMVIMQ